MTHKFIPLEEVFAHLDKNLNNEYTEQLKSLIESYDNERNGVRLSFARFSNSDVYIFEHANGFIECCGCILTEPEPDEIVGFAKLATPREAISHLEEHEASGDDVGSAIMNIRNRYEDLDAPIQPYTPDPKQLERLKAKLKVAFEGEQK